MKKNSIYSRWLPQHFFSVAKKRALIPLLVLGLSGAAAAQEVRPLSLQEAITMGIENSKQLQLSQAKVEEAIARYNQTKDKALPTGNVSYTYNHAEIPTTTFRMSEQGEPFYLPRRADAFIGTASLQEVLFSGNRLKYAQETTGLLTQIARLDVEKDEEEVAYHITEAYLSLYKLQQSQKVVNQNLEDVDRQINRAQRFFEQGLVTKNDVLRFQLQRSNIELSQVDLETNRKIVVYNLALLLGLPEDADFVAQEVASPEQLAANLSTYLDSAMVNRQELRSLGLQQRVAENNLKSVRAEKLPSVILGADAYFINPSGAFVPSKNSFIAPFTAGATVAWNFDELWLNKNKAQEAIVKRTEADLGRLTAIDMVKTEVNKSYQQYQQAKERVHILEAAIAQARENDRILESQYQNKVATATDRIDAETQLFQQLVNLELAKADAALAYYTLLKSTGNIIQ
ncbi:TolC family protein [Pontibacter mangrovi]|uniref:TolC family protein n=1 Tax=Pontibacter mangrovi TaxID=2589816 RepID=A0A501WD44_9BACT|nr:TolC family protein [Pontibacter mangrovi]TPE46014.1 TolC family protein [Pontibacter mangrovi]